MLIENLPVLQDLDSNSIRCAIKNYGAVIIRCPDLSVKDFIELSDSLMIPMVHHSTNTIERDPLGNDPRTATVNKGVEAIPLHREGSYAPGCPDLLFFFCERPSSSGGETLLCDGVELLQQLDRSTRDFVNDLELHWSWEARPIRWQQTLRSQSIEEARQVLANLKANLQPYEQLDYYFDGELLVGRFVTQAVIQSPFSQVPAFCNSLMINAYRPKSAYFARDDYRVLLGNGDPFPPEILAEISRIAERISIGINWAPCEIVVVDNWRVMHGRRNFDDLQRRIYLRMGHVRGSL